MIYTDDLEGGVIAIGEGEASLYNLIRIVRPMLLLVCLTDGMPLIAMSLRCGNRKWIPFNILVM